MAANVMKWALCSGLDAEYLVADAWFGTKPMICIDVCPVLRMKKGNMEYRAVLKNTFSMAS